MGVIPPLKGVAVKVTDDPEQNGFEDAEVVMFTGRTGLTVIVIELLDTGLLYVQTTLEEVSWQVIASLFIGVYVKVVEFVPEPIPLTFHK